MVRVHEAQAVEADERFVGHPAAHVGLCADVRANDARQTCEGTQRVVADVRREPQLGFTETRQGRLRSPHRLVAARRDDDLRAAWRRKRGRRCRRGRRRAREQEQSTRTFRDADTVRPHDLLEQRAGGLRAWRLNDAHLRLHQIAAVKDGQAACLQLIERLLERSTREFVGERDRCRIQQRQCDGGIRCVAHLIMMVPSGRTSCRRSVVASMTASASSGSRLRIEPCRMVVVALRSIAGVA